MDRCVVVVEADVDDGGPDVVDDDGPDVTGPGNMSSDAHTLWNIALYMSGIYWLCEKAFRWHSSKSVHYNLPLRFF